MDERDKILEFQRKKGLTNVALAKILNVSESTVGKWEKKKAYPSRNKFQSFAKAIGMTLEEFTNRELRPKHTREPIEVGMQEELKAIEEKDVISIYKELVECMKNNARLKEENEQLKKYARASPGMSELAVQSKRKK